MTEPEKTSAEKLAETFEVLPPEKRNYILGYAEGLADALADRQISDSIQEAVEDTER